MAKEAINGDIFIAVELTLMPHMPIKHQFLHLAEATDWAGAKAATQMFHQFESTSDTVTSGYIGTVIKLQYGLYTKAQRTMLYTPVQT